MTPPHAPSPGERCARVTIALGYNPNLRPWEGALGLFRRIFALRDLEIHILNARLAILQFIDSCLLWLLNAFPPVELRALIARNGEDLDRFQSDAVASLAQQNLPHSRRWLVARRIFGLLRLGNARWRSIFIAQFS
jgi:hypothetical protein